jgi:protein involved in polysaccharide export with SLBB domain
VTDNSSIFRLPHVMILRCLILMMSALAFFSLTACSFDAKFRRQSLEAPTKEVKLEYRSLPGDKILLTFMHNLDDSVTEEYRLQQGDGIQISVQDRDDINRVSSIAPDGNIYFPYLEPIPAAGKTLKQLGQLTEEKYQPLVKSARVSLAPVNFSGKTESLLQALSSPGRPGSNYETVIGMDGSAVFPQLGFLKIVGFTPEELNTFLQGKYRKIMPGIEVTANLTGGTSRLVTLLGELRRPGSFDISGPISLTAALGLAEGWLPSAHVQDIILVQKRAGQVSISKYDLEKDLMVATQIQLTGGDLVFVPRSAITDLNIFIDQYIRRNMPFAVGINAPLPIFQNTQNP